MLDFFGYKLAEESDVADIVNVETSNSGRDGGVTLPVVVGCLNPHSFMMAQDDAEFRDALMNCDYILPDGIGICKAAKWLNGVKVKKIAGDDFHRRVLDNLNRQLRVFYVGSTEEVLSGIVERLKNEYQNVEVGTFSPSFCKELSDEENALIVSKIVDFGADVVFVGLGAPKQERWAARVAKDLKGVKIIASIGAVFDFYSGKIKRAPKWTVKLGMEWLVRWVKEPRRMWKRNMVSAPRFLLWCFRNRNH